MLVAWMSVLALAQEPWLIDQASQMGLTFTHTNGMTGEWTILETMGSGCAFIDYDRDGDLDVYLVQGAKIGSGTMLFPPKSPLSDRLFRNDLDGATGKVSFVDVTQKSGISAAGYGMGAVVDDFDRDGWPDLYVTNYGPNQLWRNLGNGTFEDVTERTKSGDDRWSVAALFVDINNDTLPDLLITNYVEFTLENHRICPTKSGSKGYCGPSLYPDARDRLLINKGGTFEDVSQKLTEFGSALGAIALDADRDNRLDLYIANDGDPNILWLNPNNGVLVNRALEWGCAVNSRGAPEASMGVACEDSDGDGDLDIIVTHLSSETHTLYSQQKGYFEDQTLSTGIAASSRRATGFGVNWIDVDRDGWLDLFIANGNVYAIEELQRVNDPYPLHQPNHFFQNKGSGKYVDASQVAIEPFSEVSRGSAAGDFDNDGDIDLLVTNNNGPVRLLVNRHPNQYAWIGIALCEESAWYVMHAELIVTTASGRKLLRRAHSVSSYASSEDPRVLFGLGEEHGPVQLEVRYSDGVVEQFGPLTPNRYHSLVRGKGTTE
ncbi:MAG: CRTAC1 family protein [Acidobacteria bacterium]|nr:CRTAC1 family protein [Acidobacteriota bacterium]